jgi:hypothetical protein
MNIDDSHYFSYSVLYESNSTHYATAISLSPMEVAGKGRSKNSYNATLTNVTKYEKK